VATLHVRNVPEPVYELLRECAEREGRSIGAQTVVFVQNGLTEYMTQRENVRGVIERTATAAPEQRFTREVRDAVVRAQQEARALNHKTIGSEHLLLALVDLFPLLARTGVTSDAVRAQLKREKGRSPARIPFEQSAKQALELALRESLAIRSNVIDPSHLMVGVAAAGEGRGAEILQELGVDEGTLRSVVLLFDQAVAPRPPSGTQYLAVDLKGSAQNWTERLNELATEGWELMQVVDGRALLRCA
jgi:ATP-dependent Clp protease ATP-binding subunit ClpA